jgi:hypothetical protein
MKKILRYLLSITFMSVLLGGCVIPQNVTQTVSVQKDGNIEMTYEGEFGALDELFEIVDKKAPGVMGMSELEMEEMVIKKIESSPYCIELKKIKPHTFYAKLQDELKTPKNQVKFFSQIYSFVPMLVELKNISQLSSVAYEIDDLTRRNTGMQIKELEEPLDRIIKSKFVVANVKVEIDEDMVLGSNAQTIKPLPDGRKSYEWVLKRDNNNSVDFAFSFNKKDKEAYRVKKAPSGSSCKELIGKDCKCGPFVIVRTGKRMPNTPYIIKSPTGEYKGCSDQDGRTIYVPSPITGECSVKADYGSDRCKSEKQSSD